MKRTKEAHLSTEVESADHYRRCHICGSINHFSESEDHLCKSCSKPFAPFFYFEDRYTPTFGDNTLRPQTISGEFYPIRGLTVYWENF